MSQPLLVPMDAAATEQDVAHEAFELALITDEPLIMFRKRGWLRWEASLWEAERVETVSATYTFARIRSVAYGAFRLTAQRNLTAS